MAGGEDEAQRKEEGDGGNSGSEKSRSPWSQAGESRGGDVPGVRRSETTSQPLRTPEAEGQG